VKHDSETIRQIARLTYEARSRGVLDGTMAAFAGDAVFEFYGRGTGLPSMTGEARGKAAVERIINELIDNSRYSGWQEVSHTSCEDYFVGRTPPLRTIPEAT
jgi:hypothetical protein